MTALKKAFTLIEVNLAMFIMAGGILSVIGLYSLGYRESRQSREDVASAAYADAVISPLVMALSDTNLAWSAFNSLPACKPDEGWGGYVNNNGTVKGSPSSTAKSVYDAIKSKLPTLKQSWPDDAKGGTSGKGGLEAGLVFLRSDNSGVATIAFRAARNKGELMYAPMYITEVRFQGQRGK